MIQVQYPTAGGSSAARSRRKRISADLGREEKKGPVSSCCSAKACFNNNAGSVELPVHEAVTIISQVLSPSSRIPILLRCSSSIPLLAEEEEEKSLSNSRFIANVHWLRRLLVLNARILLLWMAPCGSLSPAPPGNCAKTLSLSKPCCLLTSHSRLPLRLRGPSSGGRRTKRRQVQESW